jgi:hypothetical protein
LAGRFDHQGIAFEMTDRTTIVVGEYGQLFPRRGIGLSMTTIQILVEVIDDDDLPGRRLNDPDG